MNWKDDIRLSSNYTLVFILSKERERLATTTSKLMGVVSIMVTVNGCNSIFLIKEREMKTRKNLYNMLV